MDLVGRTAREFGPLAVLIPFGFVVTAIRRPRYALLTGIALGLTVFFAASYDNAAIERYYLGPILIAWTWLAMLVAAVVDVLARARVLRRVGDVHPLVRPVAVGLLAIGILLGPALLDFSGSRPRRGPQP